MTANVYRVFYQTGMADNTCEEYTFVTLPYRRGNGGIEILSHLPKVTQRLFVRALFQTGRSYTRAQVLNSNPLENKSRSWPPVPGAISLVGVLCSTQTKPARTLVSNSIQLVNLTPLKMQKWRLRHINCLAQGQATSWGKCGAITVTEPFST